MLITLDVAYRDTSAAQLRFALGRPVLAALAVLDVAGVQVRLLGASHQVVLRTPVGTVSETLAYLADAEPMPVSRTVRLPGTGSAPVGYTFRAAVRLLDRDRFAAQVRDLVDRLAGHPAALVGMFPGAPGAVTAVLAEPLARGLRWRTWHTYPGTREVVATRTAISQTREDPAQPPPAR